MPTQNIIKQIRVLGYHVSIHRMRGGISLSGHPLPVPDRYVEMHAVGPEEPPQIFIVRIDKSGPDAERQCAFELAMMTGIDLVND